MRQAVIGLCAMVGIGAMAIAAAADWPRFRGADGSGISDARELPVSWSDTENIVWKRELPGSGASSPILWGERVYITGYSGYGEGEGAAGTRDELQCHLVCLDGATGEVVWDRAVTASPEEQEYGGRLPLHGYSSGTPATDGEVVVAFFGASGVVACDMQGKELWRASVGSRTHNFGSGTSPILFEDAVIVNASVESGSLVALHKLTGAEVWRARNIQQSWNTPLIVTPAGGEPELVVNTKGMLRAFSPQTGEPLWTCSAIDDYICPSAVAHDGIVYAIGGRQSGCVAVRAGGRGDVTQTHRLWYAEVGSNVPSPVYHDGHLYWVDHGGQTFCVNAQTGEVLSGSRERRRGRGAGTTYASVLLADGKLYSVSRENGAYVYAADPQLTQLAHNEIASDMGIFNASPTAIGNRLLLRSDRFLYCIGK